MAKPQLFDPAAPPRGKRKLRVGPPEVHEFASADNTSLRLTRYQGGSKGPVMLVHCIGVSSRMYRTDTIDTNLLEYLFERDFDVWLLDFRFSIELPTATEQSTFDDVATKDYPAAVAKVRELSGADNVQVVAHGVGSSTFSMAMLAGLQGVRSAVCSQVSMHLEVPMINEIKTDLRMASVLAAFGRETLTAYVDTTREWQDKLYDFGLRMYPYQLEERCNSPVCHRITAMYGTLYEHDQLSTKTHECLHEMFGVVNLRAFKQLSAITRAGHLIDAEGDDAYLPHAERMAIPIAFLHGAENECVLPKSTEMTCELLSERNGADLYKRHVIPKYGHVDCMFGKNAAEDVYPLIHAHLMET